MTNIERSKDRNNICYDSITLCDANTKTVWTYWISPHYAHQSTQIGSLHNTMVMRKEPILKEVYSCQSTWVPYAFKNLMIHGMLQFALLIALRYALHRCENQDIHCQESCKGCVRCFDTSTYKNQHTSDYFISNIYVLFVKITQVYLDQARKLDPK